MVVDVWWWWRKRRRSLLNLEKRSLVLLLEIGFTEICANKLVVEIDFVEKLRTEQIGNTGLGPAFLTFLWARPYP